MMNKEEQTRVSSLGKALQDARLSAALTVKEVAQQLNLAASTIRDIEDDLDNVLESKKYPRIYLRGYIANYAKLVALEGLAQFSEYQQLSITQSHLEQLRASVNSRSLQKHKRRKWPLLLFVLIVAVGIGFFTVQYFFLSNSSAEHPDTEEIKLDNKNNLKDVQLKKQIVTAAELPIMENSVAPVIIEKPENKIEKRENEIEKPESEPKTEVIIKPFASAQKAAEEKQLATEPLQLTFSADCWTEINDAAGTRLAFSLYKKGSSITVNGVAPFQLKLGDPSAVAIQYQGKTFEHEFIVARTTRFSIPEKSS